jgi:fibronectin-binding autotransporter adhesin
MPAFPRHLRPVVIATVAILGLNTPARAQTDFYWNQPGGGTGAWNTTTQNWSSVAGAGSNDHIWGNTGSERANFGNTAGTVTLGTGITVAGLVFTTGGYTITGNTLTMAGGGTIDTGANNETISSALADGGNGWSKTGSGTLTLTTTSTFTGAVNITGGVVSIPITTTFGSTGNVTLNGGGIRETNPGNAGSFISATHGIIIGANGGTVDYTPSGSDFSFTTIYAPSGTGTIGGTGVLTKTGPSEFRFQGNATGTATFTKLIVNQGLYRIGFVSGSANSEIGFGAVPGSFTPDAITLNGGQIGTSFAVILANTRGITLGANGGTLNANAATMTVPGAITGSGGLKTSTGTVTLQSATSNYTGPTTIGSVTTTTPSGTLAVTSLADGNSPSGIGASPGTAGNLVLNGGTLSYSGASVNTNRLFSITSLGGTITSSGGGPINFTNTGANLSTDKGATNFTVSPNGNSVNVVLAPGGTPDDLTGIHVGMTVTGTGIPAGATVASVAATLTQFVLSSASTGATNNTTSLSFGSLNRTLTLNGTNTGANTIAGTLADSPTKTLGVTKSGAGTWILNGANTYTGATTASAGTLIVGSVAGNGAALATGSAVSLSGTATLGGYGTINGPVTVPTGTFISPGMSAGTLTIGTASAVTGTYLWELATAGASAALNSGLSTVNGGVNDQLADTGTLNLSGSTLNISSLASTTFDNTQPYSWVIATGNTITGLPTLGTISGTDFGNLNGGTFSIGANGSNTAAYLNFTPSAVPEPGTLLLCSLTAAAGLASRRFRRLRLPAEGE